MWASSINNNKLTLLAEASHLTTSICLVLLGVHHGAHLATPHPYQTTAGLIHPSLAPCHTRVDVQGLALCSHLSPWAPSGSPGPHLQLHQSQSLEVHRRIGIPHEEEIVIVLYKHSKTLVLNWWVDNSRIIKWVIRRVLDSTTKGLLPRRFFKDELNLNKWRKSPVH